MPTIVKLMSLPGSRAHAGDVDLARADGRARAAGGNERGHVYG